MLLDLGLDVTPVDSGVNEAQYTAPNGPELAMLLARKKAEAVWETNRNSIVIGADQVAFLGDELFGKPVSESDHFNRLCSLRGRSHSLVTAVVLIYPKPGQGGLGSEVASFTETTEVHFRADVSDEELWEYVKSGEASGCAGGYMIERRGAWLVERIEGDYFNVVGLPVLALVRSLRAIGMRLGE